MRKIDLACILPSKELNKLKKTFKDIELTKSNYGDTYALCDQDDELISFSLSDFPGCCGICIVHDITVERKTSNGFNSNEEKLWDFLFKLAQGVATYEGYSLVIMTHLLTNEPYQQACFNNGWDQKVSFKNSSSKNNITVDTKILGKRIVPKTAKRGIGLSI